MAQYRIVKPHKVVDDGKVIIFRNVGKLVELNEEQFALAGDAVEPVGTEHEETAQTEEAEAPAEQPTESDEAEQKPRRGSRSRAPQPDGDTDTQAAEHANEGSNG